MTFLFGLLNINNLQRELKIRRLINALKYDAYRADHKNIRREAEIALVNLGDGKAVEPLIALMRNGSLPSGITEAAIRILGRLKDSRAINPLIELLRDEFNSNRLALEVALVNLGDGKAVEPLIALMRNGHEEPRVREAAIRILGQLKDSRAIDPLIELLDTERFDTEIFISLGKIGGSHAAEQLVAILTNHARKSNNFNNSRFQDATKALIEIGDTRVLHFLLNVTVSDDDASSFKKLLTSILEQIDIKELMNEDLIILASLRDREHSWSEWNESYGKIEYNEKTDFSEVRKFAKHELVSRGS